jgi:precorrin-2 dehydrogenase/sirohydrochlorin ferrochelatase
MSVFPIFVKLEGRPTLVVGGGSLAEARVEQLLQAQARVELLAPKATERLADFACTGQITWHQRRFQPEDVEGKRLVFAATGRRDVDREVSAVCRREGVLCNAIDDPQYCDFYAAAVVRRGDLQIAISTNGQSPGLAQRIRRELEARFDERWAERVGRLGSARRKILSAPPAGEKRKQLLDRLVSKTLEGRTTR